VHGDIDRRAFLDGAKNFTVGSLTAAGILEALRPNYAWAEQVPKTDKRIKTEWATVDSPQGNGNIKGYLVKPAGATGKLPAVLVVHENRGLNPYIEDVARRLGTSNFMAFAPDGLTSVGGFPGDNEEGGKLFAKVDRAKMVEDFVAAAKMAEGAPGLHRPARCGGFLLWRRNRQHAGRAARFGLSRRRTLLRWAARRSRRAEDQGIACDSIRVTGRADQQGLASL
jgi:hypothetical protein